MKLLLLAALAFIVFRVLPGAGRRRKERDDAGDDGAPAAVPLQALERELRAAVYGDDAAEAAGLAARLLAEVAAPNARSLNAVVCAFVFAGRYAEALALASRPAVRPEAIADADARRDAQIVQINLAEAEYNLGRWEEAAARLDTLGDPDALEATVRGGVRLQRAWILAHLGEGDAAIALVGDDLFAEVPRGQHAEVHLVRAAGLLARGRHREAEAAAHAGIDVAARASSRRNGENLLGRIALARGDAARAVERFAEAAAHEYRGQGGPELLAYGDALRDLGRGDAAARIWRLVVERDPQSAAAMEATGVSDRSSIIASPS